MRAAAETLQTLFLKKASMAGGAINHEHTLHRPTRRMPPLTDCLVLSVRDKGVL